MTTKILNFMSYNSTGMDTVKADWIQNLIKTCDIDFLQIQEHFKATKTVDKYFTQKFSESDSYVIPAYREIYQDQGRAKGGLAQLAGKKLDIKKNRIKTKNWRLQAQILNIEDYRIVWFNSYFPTDPQTVQYDDGELFPLLNEIEEILENNSFDDCILGGDFNFDKRRNTGFVGTVEDFIERIGLVSVWDKHPVDFTHIHTDLKSTSILDNFFVSKQLLDMVADAGPIHLGDNQSRHSPIMLKLRLPEIHLRKKEREILRMKKPAWYKATSDEINQYTTILADKLENITTPDSLSCRDPNCKIEEHRSECDSHVLDVMGALLEVSHACIPLSGTGSSTSAKHKGSRLPGWKESVEPARSDSLFWHAVWLSAGRPPTGVLHSLMCRTRNKFHYAVRRAKRAAEKAQSVKLMEAAEQGNKALLKEMKNTLHKKSACQKVPESLDGQDDHAAILNRFKECYEQLYNSACTEVAVGVLKERLEEIIATTAGVSNEEVDKVSWQAVKQSCSRMRPGKNDVSDAYSSDVLLHGPDILFHHLAAIFRSFITHGTVSLQILCCAFLPLFKGGVKDPGVFDSYRAIAGASQLLKLFEYVVLLTWGDVLGSDSMQFGFKRGVSTTQCTWLVHEVTTYFMRRGTAVTACLLDCSKAFDKCRFDKLFEKLIKRGLPAVVVRVLIFIYQEQVGWVKLGGVKSATFRITNGTRQGSVLSPILFTVYFDDLLGELRRLQLGCHVGGCWYGASGYADDLILLAPNRQVLQQMVSVCEKYGQDQNLVFSTDPIPSLSKTKCIFFCGRPGKVRYPELVVLDGKQLPWVEHAEHLGHTLHQVVNMEMDSNRARAKFIKKAVDIREEFAFAHPDQQLQMLDLLCCDGYGSMLWNLQSDKAEQYFKSWNTAVKMVWGVPRSTFTYLVEGYFAQKQTSLRNQVLSRYPGFIRGLLNSPSKEVRLLVRIVKDDPRSHTCLNLRYLSQKTGLEKVESYAGWRVKEALGGKTVPESERWRLGLLTTLLSMKRDKFSQVQDSKQISAMIDSLSST